MIAVSNVKQFPCLFSKISLLHHLSPFPVTRPTRLVPMVVFHQEAVVKRSWKDSSMKSREMSPDSAGNTAVMGTVLREIHRSFAVVSGFEGTNHEFTLLNWAGLCFHCHSCAPAAPWAIWALWEWIWHLIQVQVPQNKMISVSILISPSCTARSISGWTDVHDMQ